MQVAMLRICEREILPRFTHCSCECIVLCCFLHHCQWTQGSDAAVVIILCIVAKFHPSECLPDLTSCIVAKFHPSECLPDLTSVRAAEIKEGGNVTD